MMSACSAPQESLYKEQILVFGTLVDVSFWGADPALAQRASVELHQLFERIHSRWHAWQPGMLMRINERLAASHSIAVDDDAMALLRRSAELSRASGGLFDPAIGQLIALWGFHNSDLPQGPPPAAQQLEQLVALQPSMADLQFADGRLSSTSSAVQLDMGGVAKGYAIDLAIAKMRELGISNGIVNAGGDLRAIGRRGERPWRIGIRNPRGDGAIAAIEVRGDESIFTSGDYERFYQYEGRRYHHIIDPRSGYPAQGTRSVTVIHSDATTADAAATALFVAGPSQWRQVAAAMGIEQVMIIDSSGEISMTAAMKERVVLLNGER
ncbi:MAG: FAD:protein FMN transferase [Gammaproteobacteria bacterium]|nr:FAD:protein FMN transferase [Gammaproteobacteria bacterium]